MNVFKFAKIFILSVIIFSYVDSNSQGPGEEGLSNQDLDIGSDIFSDFNEDISGAEMAEDERFYRYGRFFSFALGFGMTSFDGNRGAAYINDPPGYALHLNYFMNFNVSFGLGFEFSKHHFFIEGPTLGFAANAPGLISVNALRVYFGYRYYIDTSDLGTAITYSNPYFTGRMEYWYLTNKFEDQSALDDESGGGLGFGLGFGLEFPIRLKQSYIGVEFLFHSVNYFDKFTQKYRCITGSVQCFDDMSGNAYSTMILYVINW